MKLIIYSAILFFIFSCKNDSPTKREENIIINDSLTKIDTVVKPTAQTPKTKNYKTYCNDRFQFCIDYPSSFIPQEEPINGDGRTFLSRDEKAQITAYGGFALVDVSATLDQYFEMVTSDIELSYKVLKKDYFIISYFNKNGDIVYSKTILKKIAYMGSGEKDTDVFQTLMITYPKNQTHLYDSYCKKIMKSFI
jgi:hypothetical protein